MKLKLKVMIIIIICPLLICTRAYAYFSDSVQPSLMLKTASNAMFYLNTSIGNVIDFSGNSVVKQTQTTVDTAFGKKTSQGLAINLGDVPRPAEANLALISGNITVSYVNLMQLTNKSNKSLNVTMEMVDGVLPNQVDLLKKWVSPVFIDSNSSTITLASGQKAGITLVATVGVRLVLSLAVVGLGTYTGFLKITMQESGQSTSQIMQIPFSAKVIDTLQLGIY